VLLARAADGTPPDTYRPAQLNPADRDPKVIDLDFNCFRTRGDNPEFSLESLNAYRRVDPDADTTEITRDISLVPAAPPINGR
jgi:hypothetical protein